MSTDSLQECAFSLCHVTSRGTHCARRALFPDHSPTNDLDVSRSESNVVVQQPKDKLDVDNLLVHQTFVETLAVMMTCSSPTNIRVLSPPLEYIYHAHTIIKHVLPAPLLEDSTFSGVSLKTQLVLTIAGIVRPSHRFICLEDPRSPDLIIASCNDYHQSPDLITAPAVAREHSVCGRPLGQPQRCSTLL